MLKSVHYGPHTFPPWCGGSGFVDKDAKSLKSYRSREPRSIWQSLNARSEDLGTYDVHFCPRCLLYSSLKQDIETHTPHCRYRHGIPGRKVFEDDDYEFLEVYTPVAAVRLKGDLATRPSSTTPGGYDSVKLYLQCLSLFGHLLLDTKSICFSVDEFLFYTAIEKKTQLLAGFFSKEIHSWHNYNLACIVTFPPWQHAGLGQRLIALSYMLTRHANTTGSPEKPLSTHGQKAYNRYWKKAVLRLCLARAHRRQKTKLTLRDIAKHTGIDVGDLATVLQNCEALISGNNPQLHLSRLL